jgi:hypothetical protein
MRSADVQGGRANSGDIIAVLEPIRQDASIRVDTQRLANGVYMLGGASHNSVAVEFKDYVAVVEAPLDEARTSRHEEAAAPNKPIPFRSSRTSTTTTSAGCARQAH